MNPTVTLNGTQIYFEIHGAGDPVLLLHGFSGSSADWARTIAALAHPLSAHRARPARPRPVGNSLAAFPPPGCRARHARAARPLEAGFVQSPRRQRRRQRPATHRHHAARSPASHGVGATPYFPAQARPIMRDYRRHLSAEQWEFLRRAHPGGDPQIEALLRKARNPSRTVTTISASRRLSWPPFARTRSSCRAIGIRSTRWNFQSK